MTNQAVFSHVYSVLAAREGRKTTLPTLASLTGLQERQIQVSIANARRTNATYARQIEVVKPAREWRLNLSAEVIDYPSADEIVKEVEVGSLHIWKRVLKALTDNTGTVVSKEQLAREASLPDAPIAPQQAANAMLTIMRQPIIGQNIDVIKAGSNWRYRASESTEVKPKAKLVSSSIRGSVYRYVLEHPSEVLTADQIANDLGFSIKQVQNAMYDIVTGNAEFTVIQRGHTWQYTPRPKPETNGSATLADKKLPAQTYTPAPTTPAQTEAPRVAQSTPVATATTTSRLFEEVGQVGDDVLVKEAESGTIYRATPLR